MKKNMKKLVLGSETIRSLAHRQLGGVDGGAVPTFNALCPGSNTPTCIQGGCHGHTI